MRDAIAIAIARAKLRRKKLPHNVSLEPESLSSVNQELTRTILIILMVSGVVIGLGALTCLAVGLVKSGGIKQFFSGLFAALGLM